MKNDKIFEKLFQPGQIGRMQVKNRIVMPPMGTFCGSEEGFVTNRLKAYYEARARGGAGLIIVESAYPHPAGKATLDEIGISDDKFIPGLSKLANVIKNHGAKAAIQLNYAGRVSSASVLGEQPVGPSSVRTWHTLYGPESSIPRELSVAEIREIVASFAKAAIRAKGAGFDGVEIHAAHGYLFAQFLSRASNKRQDAYGGNIENRARLLIDVIKAIRGAVGADYPVWCRINGKEYGVEDGITLEEAQETAKLAQEAGADAIHVSAETAPGSPLALASMPFVRGAFVDLAEGVKKVVTVPVIAVGFITPEIGERILEQQKADFIAMGRALIADPDLPNKVASGKMDDIIPCICCYSCVKGIFNEIFYRPDRTATRSGLRCAVNVSTGREKEYKITRTKKPKKVLVVGGGPAGMEASRVAALRGHQVSLYEKESRLGGQLIQAAVPPRKEWTKPLIRYLESQVRKLGVEVQLGKEVTSSLVQEVKPEVVIVANGVIPFIPDIRGIDKANVVQAIDILDGKADAGEKVVVIGGELVGCETAEFLAERGKKVTVTRRGPEMAKNMFPMLREYLLGRLSTIGVTLLTGVRYEEITPRGLVLTTKEGRREIIEADTIVLAASSTSNRKLFVELEGKVGAIRTVGDCVEPRSIKEAIAEGFHVAHQL